MYYALIYENYLLIGNKMKENSFYKHPLNGSVWWYLYVMAIKTFCYKALKNVCLCRVS